MSRWIVNGRRVVSRSGLAEQFARKCPPGVTTEKGKKGGTFYRSKTGKPTYCEGTGWQGPPGAAAGGGVLSRVASFLKGLIAQKQGKAPAAAKPAGAAKGKYPVAKPAGAAKGKYPVAKPAGAAKGKYPVAKPAGTQAEKQPGEKSKLAEPMKKPAAKPADGKPAEKKLSPEAKGVLNGMWKSMAHLPPETRQKYTQSASKVLGNMNAKALARLSSNLVKTDFHASAKDLGKAAANIAVERGNHQQAKEFEGVGGMYYMVRRENLMGGGHVLLDGDMKKDNPGGWSVGEHQAHQTYSHELAHVIDGGDNWKTRISGQQDWKSSWKEEIAGKSKGRYRLNSYGSSSTTEGFAEFGRLIFSGDYDHKEVQKKFPKCYAVWKKHGLVD